MIVVVVSFVCFYDRRCSSEKAKKQTQKIETLKQHNWENQEEENTEDVGNDKKLWKFSSKLTWTSKELRSNFMSHDDDGQGFCVLI